jgi:hypothetical protein
MGIFQQGLNLITPNLPFPMLKTVKGSKRGWPTQKMPQNIPIYVIPVKKNKPPTLSDPAVHIQL